MVFRCRVLQCDNILLKAIVNIMYFMWSKMSRKWTAAIPGDEIVLP